MKESCCLASDQHFLFKYFPENTPISKIFPRLLGLFWPLWVFFIRLYEYSIKLGFSDKTQAHCISLAGCRLRVAVIQPWTLGHRDITTDSHICSHITGTCYAYKFEKIPMAPHLSREFFFKNNHKKRKNHWFSIFMALNSLLH